MLTYSVKNTAMTLELPGRRTIILMGCVYSISINNVLRELIICDLRFPEG